MKNILRLGATVLSALLLLGCIACPALSQDLGQNEALSYIDSDGQLIVGYVTPPSPPPPGYKEAVTTSAEPSSDATQGVNILQNVPSFDWAYGCSAVSAGMLMGYYDRNGYDRMYTGPANGGVCPTTNRSTWGYTECPIVASHQGIDGRNTRGHVDDYWIAANNYDTDPFVAHGWAEHTPQDCTGDFMGTSQKKWSMPDGSTIFFYNSNGSPLYDNTGCEPWNRDGAHGMKLYAESKGYTVTTVYNQMVAGYATTAGFTFTQFMAEIDAGYPVLIQLEGHTMLGYGYDSSNQMIYIHNTWDNSYDTMIWGQPYSGMKHRGVTVFHLGPTKIETPTFTPPSGTYSDPVNVVVDCATPGVTIHYTTSSLNPTTNDPVIPQGGTLYIDHTTVLCARAYKTNMTDSEIKTAGYTLKVTAPTLSPPGGAYESGTTVTMSTITPNSEIHYTTNGLDPAKTDPLASGPVTLSQSCTVKAKAFRTSWTNSTTTTAAFTIYEAASVTGAKRKADSSGVSCQNAIVTQTLPNAFFIETEDRLNGLRVNMTGHAFTPGVRVNVLGTVKTSGGERYIDAITAYAVGVGSVAPFYMSCRDLGGKDWFYDSATGAGQAGMSDGRGPNNIGLLVRTSGAFTYVDSGRFRVSDGSGTVVECVTPPGVLIDPNWQYVSVTGVSGCESAGGSAIKRVLRIGSQDGIVSLKGASIGGKVSTPGGSQIVNQVIESLHPYANNSNIDWIFSGPVGTTQIRAHIAQYELQTAADWLRLLDASDTTKKAYSGPVTYNVWSSWIAGSFIKLRLVSDASTTRYGFQADQFECTTTASPVSGATVTLNPGARTAVTRGDGSYCFDGLAAGDYTVSGSIPGASFAASLPVSVSEGQRVANADLTASSTNGSLGGRVMQNATLTGLQTVECAHPYPNSYNSTWSLNAPPNAVQMRAHFSEIELETSYDYLHVRDSAGALQQSYNNGTAAFDQWTNWVMGSGMQFNLITSASTNRYGFQVDRYEYQVATPVGGVTVSVSPSGLSTVTGKDGTFLFYGLANGTYTVTPTMAGVTLTPTNRSVTISGMAHQTGTDFTRN